MTPPPGAGPLGPAEQPTLFGGPGGSPFAEREGTDRMDDAPAPTLSAAELSRALGQEHPPTAEQAAIIEAPLRPQLVVAGAGSGKTETMTARVVWLVANGLVQPEEVLGLTFTRKAAGELADRVGARLATLERTGLWQAQRTDVSGALTLPGAPTITTYHAYAGSLVREHAPLLGRERDARLLTEAAAWQLAHEAVLGYDGPMDQVEWVESTVTSMVVDLAGELAEHLREPEEAIAHLDALVERWERAEASSTRLKAMTDQREALRRRALVLPVVRRYLELKHERGVLDFADQMALAARLAGSAPQVGTGERDRFRVVLLDEFQDTSEAQLVLMTGLFAPDGSEPSPVTAVGDPHQSIYAWRGASATTLATFPERFGDAPVLHLSRSWRNDTAVLDAANEVARPLREASAVPVRPLQARPGAQRGQVWAARVADARAEAQLVAEWVEQRRGDGRFSAAVLCRKRSQFAVIAEALAERGVPHEVVGLGGLLVTSEVADVVALLAVVQDPARGDRLMRLLTGPTCRLGAADVAGLAAWARELGPRAGRAPGTDLAQDSREETTIVDALDQLPEPGWVGSRGETISGRALERLRALASGISTLRGLTGLPLPDLVAHAEQVLGVDVEVLARPGWSPGAARAHLDAFADVAAQFAAGADRSTLGGFLDWVEAAVARERGLERPVVDPTPDAVQILTCHAAKGLEWDVVAVPGLVEGSFPSHNARSRHDAETGEWTLGTVRDSGWLHATEGGVPYPLRGDRHGLPSLGEHGATTKEIEADVTAFKEASGEQLLTEERRLAYVAFTRARRHLLLTSAVWAATGSTPRLASRFFDEVAALPGVHRIADAPMPRDDEANPLLERSRTVTWPSMPPAPERPALGRAAARLADRQGKGGSDESGGDDFAGGASPTSLAGRHELDETIELLLREREAARTPTSPAVTLPEHLSTSSLVAVAGDEASYAAQLRRPMPSPPAPEARRGTDFHAWVEQHYGTTAMVDVLDLPGRADAESDDVDLPALQERFLASEWAERTPVEVELSLEFVLAGRAVRGRVDAVFADPDGGVTIVDWKTGRPPRGSSADGAALQLSVYRLAYARWSGLDPARVRAALFYAGTGETVRPRLLSEEQVAAVLTGEGV
ncbi:ATP-dependent DNA helicase [Marihabitans asiaticum]|uniref:DNA 3'-5' helicase n=1 Tax=Marihabitans asiaticum TaxID=415218 RepID=A0A560WIG6_9MICO|nr:ATP-dependent DNA helicase [Marihabitans asiaticum]TWD17348.1 DNA helicase-2/ATP-dependent DNA helicase PcrA [Marihabitans asiaticum]